MKISIVGAGKLGVEIARRVCADGHDVILIDRDETRLARVEEKLDLLTIKGNGATTSVLGDTAVATSDLLLALTESDELNIIACMNAKKIGIKKTVARVRDPDFAWDPVLIKENFDVDLAINPEFAAAQEVCRLLTMSLAVHTEPFGDGRVQMAEIAVDDEAAAYLAGKPLSELDLPMPSLVVGISRGGEMVIPGGQSIIKPGDTVYMLGNFASISEVCAKIKRKKKHPVQNVIILGGGRIGYYLANKLNKLNINVKIIEQRPDRCRELAEKLPGVLVLQGDGTDLDFLQREGIRDTDGFVAVTGIDEENLLVSLLAKQMGAKQVIAKVSRPNYINMVERLGVDSAISPLPIVVAEVLRFIQGGRLLSVFLLLNGQAEVVELIVQPGSKLANRSLSSSGLPGGVIIGAILRGGQTIIPRGDEVVREHDHLVVFSLGNRLQTVENFVSTGGKN